MVSKRRIGSLSAGILAGAALLVGQVTMAAADGVGASSSTVTVPQDPSCTFTTIAANPSANQSVYNILATPNPSANQSVYNILATPNPFMNQSVYNILVTPNPSQNQSVYNILVGVTVCF